MDFCLQFRFKNLIVTDLIQLPRANDPPTAITGATFAGNRRSCRPVVFDRKLLPSVNVSQRDHVQIFIVTSFALLGQKVKLAVRIATVIQKSEWSVRFHLGNGIDFDRVSATVIWVVDQIARDLSDDRLDRIIPLGKDPFSDMRFANTDLIRSRLVVIHHGVESHEFCLLSRYSKSQKFVCVES